MTQPMTIRYFSALELEPEYEVEESEARARGTYNLVHFDGSKPMRAEAYRSGSLASVVYFRDAWPPPMAGELLFFTEHAQTYDGVAYRVLCRSSSLEHGVIDQHIFWYNASGERQRSVETKMDKRREPLRELIRGPDGVLEEIVEYDYNESDGARLRERHYDRDGQHLFTEEYDD